ncbi:hypothetical protein F5878DRAFT_678139 [Lentinula raphanica]|uniref:Uncharacterized protein n=1 Tax=Lentinula raphanica TaxID=153919 RepID=A0AA38PBA0_9AGAR|nr:hypothetical protein F5878DRAFT_678139 [Lentinula raphanica]
MLHFALSLFSPRGLSILLLAVCLLRVPAMDQPPDSGGTRTVGLSDSVTSATIVLLRFLGHGDVPPLPEDVDVEELSWSRIGSAHFQFGGHVIDEVFEQAKELTNEYQPHLTSNDMNEWWYMYNIMWSLHEYHSISSKTMKTWEDTLPKSFESRNLIKGTKISVIVCYLDRTLRVPAEEAYLRLGDLLISPGQEYSVPYTESAVPNPPRRSGSTDSPIGEIRKDINIDQVRAYNESHSTIGFHGEHEDVENWKKSVAEWRKMDAAALARYKQYRGPMKEPKTYSVALKFWNNIDDWMYALYALRAISEAELDAWVQLRSTMVKKLVKAIDNRVKERARKSKPETVHV